MGFYALIFPEFVLAVVVIGPIWMIWGNNGSTITGFVTWWCRIIGVSSQPSIDIAIGVFAGISLAATIAYIWSLILKLVALADASHRVNSVWMRR